MQQKAIVILSPGFPNNEAETTCLPPVQVIVRALQKRYPQTQIIVLSFQYPFKTSQYQWHKVKVYSFGGRSRKMGFRLLIWLRVAIQFRSLRRKYNVIGLLSLWLGECALVGKYLAKQYDLTHYVWLLGQDGKANNRFFNRVQPESNEIIALSDFLSSTFNKNYGIRPAHTIPVGVDTTMFGLQESRRTIDIMGAGSLIPLKQYELFIEAVRYLTYFIPDIYTVICGDGPERERLESLISQYNLQQNVLLLGEEPHQEVVRLMQCSKIFLHPSSYEGFGTVIAEALYAGAHVVSFCEPMNAVSRHHHVVNNISQMQQTILSLLNQTRLDHNAVLLFSAEDVADKVMALYGQTSSTA